MVCFLLLAVFFFPALALSQQRVYLDINQKPCNEDQAFYYLILDPVKDNMTPFRQYYKNGILFAEGNFIGPTPKLNEPGYSGTCIWFHKNGQKSAVRNFSKDGLEEGTSHWYYADGKPSKSVTFKNGTPTGPATEFLPDGTSSLIFTEDFDRNVNNWDLYASDKGEAKIENDHLILTSFGNKGTSRYIPMQVSGNTFSIELTCGLPSENAAGMYGLLYNFKDWTHYSYFLIKGTYFYIGGMFEGVSFRHASGIYAMEINKAGPNVIKLMASKDKSIYSINGSVVFSSSGCRQDYQVGLAVGGKGTAFAEKLVVKEFENTDSNGDFDRTGTGFLISHNMVVTNYHVVEEAMNMVISFSDGTENAYPLKIVASDKETDLAILKIEHEKFNMVKPLPYKLREQQMEVGNTCFVLGYPLPFGGLGKEIKFSDGKLSAKTGFNGNVRLYQTSVPVKGGNSGSPLFDEKGCLAGIVNAKFGESDNISYAIKLNYLKALAESMEPPFVFPEPAEYTEGSIEETIKRLTPMVGLIKVKK